MVGIDLLGVSGPGLLRTLSAAAGTQTVASELEVNLPDSAELNLDQEKVSGFEEHPDLVGVAGWFLG